MITPYYDSDGITIYHGDCREVLPLLSGIGLVLTDPPYGIGRSVRANGGKSGFYPAREARRWSDSWDIRPDDDLMRDITSTIAIIWGGNYFAHALDPSTHWLVWDKQNTMPSFSDCELAWTNLPKKKREDAQMEWQWIDGRRKKPMSPNAKTCAAHEMVRPANIR